MPNPLLTLPYETAIADLGPDYADPVTAAEFPRHLLRFRNNDLLSILGLEPERVADEDFLEAFGYFQGPGPFLALRYHGYQFGEYNPSLGDGRGFLYGQVRGTDGKLYDLGTKGSGQTPYSRTADGRLTLKGGVREVLAAEVLHQLGVNTSRCLSLIETGESLWRGDEPSPTRSSVMVRFSQSHIRFGTFERLHYLQRPDLIPPLLDHAIALYYPEITATETAERYVQFYQTLVARVATLAAQWMVAGFCHGVLNTDNMSITGESFDYGPYAFIPTFDPKFTAAYFDYSGRYCYGNQPGICRLNLELLQAPLRMVMEKAELETALEMFDQHYFQAYRTLLLRRLGLQDLRFELAHELVQTTVQLLAETQVDYGGFFAQLSREFNPQWRKDGAQIFPNPENSAELWQLWRDRYHQALTEYPAEAMTTIQNQLQAANPQTPLLRPVIETVWEAIANEDDWQPFNALLAKIAAKA